MEDIQDILAEFNEPLDEYSYLNNFSSSNDQGPTSFFDDHAQNNTETLVENDDNQNNAITNDDENFDNYFMSDTPRPSQQQQQQQQQQQHQQQQQQQQPQSHQPMYQNNNSQDPAFNFFNSRTDGTYMTEIDESRGFPHFNDTNNKTEINNHNVGSINSFTPAGGDKNKSPTFDNKNNENDQDNDFPENMNISTQEDQNFASFDNDPEIDTNMDLQETRQENKDIGFSNIPNLNTSSQPNQEINLNNSNPKQSKALDTQMSDGDFFVSMAPTQPLDPPHNSTMDGYGHKNLQENDTVHQSDPQSLYLSNDPNKLESSLSFIQQFQTIANPEKKRRYLVDFRDLNQPQVCDLNSQPSEKLKREDVILMISTVDKLVNEAWIKAYRPYPFASSVQLTLMSLDKSEHSTLVISDDKAKASSENNNSDQKKISSTSYPQDAWRLKPIWEELLSYTLIKYAVKISVPDSRIFCYIKECIAVGLMSSRRMLCDLINAIIQAKMSSSIEKAFLKLLAQLVSWYMFSSTDSEMEAECDEFLCAIGMLIRSVIKHQSIAGTVVSMIRNERIIALARAAGRRNKDSWLKNIGPFCTHDLEALQIPSILDSIICPLRDGLGAIAINLQTDPENSNFLIPKYSETHSKSSPFTISVQNIIKNMAPEVESSYSKFFEILWTQREIQGGDMVLLTALEAAGSASTEKQNKMEDYLGTDKNSLVSKVRACEIAIRHLTIAVHESSPDQVQRWLREWGGVERTLRLLRNVLPQIRTQLKSELSCILVACAIIGVCALSVGSYVSRTVRIADNIEPPKTTHEEVLQEVGQIRSFATSFIEDAALEEEPVPWRSFGVWLLLFASKVGSLLGVSGDEFIHTVKLLQAWCVIGISGFSEIRSSTRVTSALDREITQKIGGTVCINVLDISDKTGSDECIHALCGDMVY